MRRIDTEIGSCLVITNQEALDLLVEHLDRTEERIALDTESYPLTDLYGNRASALDTHTSQCRLISLYWMSLDIPYVIDVRELDLSNLALVLSKSSLEKVSHYATHDMKVLRKLLGVWLPNWKCSSIAMCTLGVSTGWKASSFRGHKLRDLARDYFSIHLQKELGKSDWSGDLSDEQLVYSAIDVSAPFNNKGIHSIVLEGYELLRQASIDMGQEWSFNLDQDVVPILSRAEYTGLPVGSNVVTSIAQESHQLVAIRRMDLCKKLNIPIQESVVLDEEGNFQVEMVIPEWASTLLNNNKALVKYMDKVLRESTGIGLSNLKAETLEAALKTIDDLDEEEIDNSNLDLGIDSINTLLSYKKLAKLETEALKYLSALNPVTNCIHTTTRCIGTSTGRMSSSGDKEASGASINGQQISTIPITIDVTTNLYDTSSVVVG
jgi:DNA polymerase I-like protein with 3'-5' exonuclease and polymerase domains